MKLDLPTYLKIWHHLWMLHNVNFFVHPIFLSLSLQGTYPSIWDLRVDWNSNKQCINLVLDQRNKYANIHSISDMFHFALDCVQKYPHWQSTDFVDLDSSPLSMAAKVPFIYYVITFRVKGALCVEMGLTWTFPRNQDATVKLKSELISIKF